MRKVCKIALFCLAAVVLFVVPPTIFFAIRYYHALEQEVISRFSGKRWNIPSRIYSDSLLVYPGENLDDLGFFQRLARLNYHRVGPGENVTVRGEYGYQPARRRLTVFLHAFSYPYQRFGGEPVQIVLDPKGTILAILDPLSGKALDSFELEPELISGIYQGSWEQRRLVRLSQLPPALSDAIMAAEDHRFYQHHGLDLVRIVKAGWVDLVSHRIVQGGSTLTQQLMKNFFLTQRRDWHRKIKEAVMAYIAERLYSKDEILENYINDIYLGQRGQEGIYGVWEASEYYFSSEPRDLTLGEMATIGGMIRSPNHYNPLHHPAAARQRRDEVLQQMYRDGYISAAARDQALAEPMRAREVFVENNDAPYFVDYVKRELAERYPPEVLTGEGLRIFTTLDVHTQKVAERAVEHNLEILEARYPRLRRRESATDRLQGALIALEPQSGKIRAMVGGRNYRDSQFNRVTQSKRQPGSLFKPVTYLAALKETLEGSARFLPTTLIEDAPFTWQYGNMSWSPKNYKDRYFGTVPLEFALSESLNCATARLAYAVGLDHIRAMAQALGFGELPPYPSIVLGGVEVSPMQVAHAYAIMANEGLLVPPYAVTAVVDENGKVIEGHEIKGEQVLSPELAYAIDFMLQQVIEHGTGHGARLAGFTRPAAGKTGTTNDSYDAWFSGFTPDLLAVVWTGFDKKEDLNLTGAQAALPIWTSFMSAATAGHPVSDFPVPPGLVVEKVDRASGDVPSPYCGPLIPGVFPIGMQPTQPCPPVSAGGGTPAVDRAPLPAVPESDPNH